MWNSSGGVTEGRWCKGRKIRSVMNRHHCFCSRWDNLFGRVLVGVMDRQKWIIDKIRQTWYERIPMTPEMCTLPHLFSKNISWIYFARDVLNIDGFILHPFPNWVFLKLNVACSSRSHIVWPSDASIYVIVEKSPLRYVRENVARIRNALTKIAKVNGFLWCGICVCGPDFHFTRTKGSKFLVFANPTNRTPIVKDDAAVHTVELKEWKESAVGNSTTNLGVPTGITIRRECGWVDGLGRNSIFVGLNIGGRRKMDKGAHRSNILRRKGYAIIMHRVDVLECVECRFNICPAEGFLICKDRKEWTAARSGQVVLESQPMLLIKLW